MVCGAGGRAGGTARAVRSTSIHAAISERRARCGQTARRDSRTYRRDRRGVAALVLHGLGGLRGGLRVEVAAAGLIRPESVVELVDQRDAGRDVQRGDLVVADAVQVLDQGAQRVAVRHHQHRPASAARSGTIASYQ